MASLMFNVNPKTGPTPSQKELAARIMFGDRRAAALRNSEDSRRAGLRAALATHHSDVPKAGGGHGGNPNHDEHGRFT